MKVVPLLILLVFMLHSQGISQDKRARDHGIQIGVLDPGKWNAITDVEGVLVGHTTRIEGQDIRTGVTAILPHSQNLYQFKVPAAIYIGNGYGKLAGYSQVEELGTIESPIILTNTLSVGTGVEAVVKYSLEQKGNESVKSVNAVVGETNDGRLNDIRGMHLDHQDFLKAIESAESGKISEGNVGAGTGTRCFGFKGGIGTASRVLPSSLGGYTIGVLVQSNFGGVLEINGAPVGKELESYIFRDYLEDADGSCMIVIATDAPVDARNLKRMAKRAMMGLAKTGGIASNGSGDYVIAFSTNKENRESMAKQGNTYKLELLKNSRMSPLFLATIEATEEAIINSLFAAKKMTGKDGVTINALPVEETLAILKKYNRIDSKDD